MIINSVNNKQNTKSNFGSIHISKNVGHKPMSGLLNEIKDTFHIISINSKNPDIIREKIQYGQAAIALTKEKGIMVVGKDATEEQFLFKKISAKFDPDAKLVEDAPQAKPEGPIINLLG
jgi:hypothetical protein